MAQMNPLIGPKLDGATIRIMARGWVNIDNYCYFIIVLLTVEFDFVI